jgi:hypothetical protein
MWKDLKKTMFQSIYRFVPCNDAHVLSCDFFFISLINDMCGKCASTPVNVKYETK